VLFVLDFCPLAARVERAGLQGRWRSGVIAGSPESLSTNAGRRPWDRLNWFSQRSSREVR
jgi:hypothetical protein